MDTNEWPEITSDTTLDELKEIHERIWNYAIENLRKPSTPYCNDCAFCEYMRKMIKWPACFCVGCPIQRVCIGWGILTG